MQTWNRSEDKENAQINKRKKKPEEEIMELMTEYLQMEEAMTRKYTKYKGTRYQV